MTVAEMKRRLQAMLNVRRSQTGAKAAATQRKIEALYAEIRTLDPSFR